MVAFALCIEGTSPNKGNGSTKGANPNKNYIQFREPTPNILGTKWLIINVMVPTTIKAIALSLYSTMVPASLIFPTADLAISVLPRHVSGNGRTCQAVDGDGSAFPG